MKQSFKWMTILTLVMFGTCCVSSVSNVSYQQQSSKSCETTAERLNTATIALVQQVKNNNKLYAAATCSGVWISQNSFITAAHCVRPDVDVVARLFGFEIKSNPVGVKHSFLTQKDIKNKDLDRLIEIESVRTATVTAYDHENDLALLKVEDENDIPKNHPIICIDRSKVRVGDNVHVVGHTSGLWWSYTRGYVAGERNMKNAGGDNVHVFQISAPVWKGNSGGGVFNESGKLIGVASFIIRGGPNLSFFTHRNVVLTFLINANAIDV